MSSSTGGGMSRPQIPDEIRFRQTVMLLAILLVLQLGTAVLLFNMQKVYRSKEQVSTEGFLSVEAPQVKKISIEFGKAATLEPSKFSLLQLDKHWVVAERHNFPASEACVRDVLQMFKGWKKGVPITTTPDAIERFRLSPDKFELCITLEDGHKKSDKFFLSSSPRFKSKYLRKADSNDIYQVDMPDQSLLPSTAELSMNQYGLEPVIYGLESLTINGKELKDTGKGQWVANVDGKDHFVWRSAAQRIVTVAFHFPIKDLLGVENKPEYNMDKPDLVCTLKMNHGAKTVAAKSAESKSAENAENTNSITYTFSKPKNKPYYVLKMSTNDFYVTVDDQTVTTIKKLPELFVLKEKAEKEKAEKQKTDAAKQKEAFDKLRAKSQDAKSAKTPDS